MRERPGWGLALPVSERNALANTSLGAVVYCAAGLAGIAVAAFAGDALARPALTLSVSLVAVLTSVALWGFRLRPSLLHRYFGPVLWVLQLSGPPLVSLALVGTGAHVQLAVTLYVAVTIYAAYLLRPAFAAALAALAIAAFAVVVYSQDGWVRPWVQVLFLAATLASTTFTFGALLRIGYSEAARLSGFRRFLPDPVANAVVTGGEGDLFEPHRRAITVVFSDLRGFTRFAASASPEDIQDVLNSYFALVGEHLDALGATVGAILGDGVMAYFGDPIPVPDPCDRAVRFADVVKAPMEQLVGRWASRGYHLSYGIGIAHGYATLGVVGLEGRHDYTALGPVVNLAARLSDAAGPGETLIDQRAMAEVQRRPDTEARLVTLKGFDEQQPVHVLR